MKNLLLILCISLSANFSFSQSWSFQDGYLAGRTYRQMDRQDMLTASYNYAKQIGQLDYALGLIDGWYSIQSNPGGGNSHNTNWDFITGGDYDPWYGDLNPGPGNDGPVVELP